MSEFSMLDYALALWRLELSVFPVPRPLPSAQPGRPGDGKTPALGWKPFQAARADEQQVREWFTGKDHNVAVITGAVSSLVVVDTDSREAEEWAHKHLPRTPWRVETSKGWHRYYRHPGVAVGNRARVDTRGGRFAIDVRGDGGFVIGPGSRHASGHVYRAVGDWSQGVSKLPAFWPGWLTRPKPARRVVAPGGVRAFPSSGDILTRGRAYLKAIPRPIDGCGSDTATFSAACRLVRGFGLDRAAATELLTEWCPSDFEREWIGAKVAAAERYGDEPVGALL